MKGHADFIVEETFGEFGERMLDLECNKRYGNGNEPIPNKLLGHDCHCHLLL